MNTVQYSEERGMTHLSLMQNHAAYSLTAADGADLAKMELDAAVEMLHPAQHFRRNSVSGFLSTGQSEAQSESVQLSEDALLDLEPPLVGDQEAMSGTMVAFVSLMFENARYIYRNTCRSCVHHRVTSLEGWHCCLCIR